MTSALLMSWEDEFEMLRIEYGIEYGENGTARVTNCARVSGEIKERFAEFLEHTNVLDTLSEHHFMKDLASAEPHKSATYQCIPTYRDPTLDRIRVVHLWPVDIL